MVLCYGACDIRFSDQLPSTEATINLRVPSIIFLPCHILSSLNKCSAYLSILYSPPLSLTQLILQQNVNSLVLAISWNFKYILGVSTFSPSRCLY